MIHAVQQSRGFKAGVQDLISVKDLVAGGFAPLTPARGYVVSERPAVIRNAAVVQRDVYAAVIVQRILIDGLPVAADPIVFDTFGLCSLIPDGNKTAAFRHVVADAEARLLADGDREGLGGGLPLSGIIRQRERDRARFLRSHGDPLGFPAPEAAITVDKITVTVVVSYVINNILGVLNRPDAAEEVSFLLTLVFEIKRHRLTDFHAIGVRIQRLARLVSLLIHNEDREAVGEECELAVDDDVGVFFCLAVVEVIERDHIAVGETGVGDVQCQGDEGPGVAGLPIFAVQRQGDIQRRDGVIADAVGGNFRGHERNALRHVAADCDADLADRLGQLLLRQLRVLHNLDDVCADVGIEIINIHLIPTITGAVDEGMFHCERIRKLTSDEILRIVR